MIVFGLLGAAALWLLYGWLLAAIVSAYLSERKGYGEKPGLASGLFLYPLGVILHNLAWFGFAEFAFFLVILGVAYVYIWRKGALEWR